jgi:mono/diheme cytochrome c family protein
MKGRLSQSDRAGGPRRRKRLEPLSFCAIVILGLCIAFRSSAAAPSAADKFRKEIQPILSQYCYDCHGDGADKGGIVLDEFKSDEAMLKDRELWWNVLKNVRAGIMPPAKKPRPSEQDLHKLADWIKQGPFGIDPKNPDPGRVTIRRLNRVEYRNTIHDLMGIDFNTTEEFPPDDTGYGFDTIGDVLSVSPLLLEKYMQAAEKIVAASVPTAAKVVGETTIAGRDFHAAEAKENGERMSFYKAATVSAKFNAEKKGDYRLGINLIVHGGFDFDPGKCKFILKVDGTEAWQQEFVWQDGKKYAIGVPASWVAGEHRLALEMQPLTPSDKKVSSVDMQIESVRIQGPLDEKEWLPTKGHQRFFSKEENPKDPGELRHYARDMVAAFAKKAFRRPADARTIDRLVKIAEAVYTQKGKSFEQGVSQAMVAILSSPRFLFRVERSTPQSAGEAFSPIDEYSLASRLSYFLWSTMPDDELFALADRGELRKNLPAQIKRLLDDTRSEALIENFTGQWLQARDVEGIAIDARLVLARDNGQEKELQKELEAFRARRAEIEAQIKAGITPTPGQFKRPRLFADPAVQLDGPLRRAMRQEPELYFAGIVREDRSLSELLDSDYTFLNDKLAKHYGVPDVTGKEMRRVTLPKDSPRGGLLTMGSVLVVTSNPTRTSPVKRGQFILDNILGLPAPPPPADVPALEESEKGMKDREPTMREVLAIHRDNTLCRSCHARMDPLGLSMESFNAMGMWRESERGQRIDPAGQLLTGETFKDVRELKQILKKNHLPDFYRCLTEKLLTYALGRGLDYYDVEAVDRIVEKLQQNDGHFSALLTGVIESTPFQERRN